MPDLTPERRRQIARRCDEAARSVDGAGGLMYTAAPEMRSLLAALDAAEQERDAAEEALHAAGVCVAALDVAALDPDHIDVGEVGRLVTVANRFITDELRAQVGQPCIDGDSLAALLSRAASGPVNEEVNNKGG